MSSEGQRFGLRQQEIISFLLPIAPILLPLTYHFVLLCFVFLSDWLPLTYLFSHVFLIGVGVWALHAKRDILPAIVFVAVVLITILLDIIQLGLYFPRFQSANGSGNTSDNRTWQFSAGMCIINLLLKPLSAALGCIAVFFRAGGSIKGLGANTGDSYSTLHGSDNEQAAAQ